MLWCVTCQALPNDKPFVVSLKLAHHQRWPAQTLVVWMQIIGDDIGDTKEGV